MKKVGEIDISKSSNVNVHYSRDSVEIEIASNDDTIWPYFISNFRLDSKDAKKFAEMVLEAAEKSETYQENMN